MSSIDVYSIKNKQTHYLMFSLIKRICLTRSYSNLFKANLIKESGIFKISWKMLIKNPKRAN